LKDFINPAVAIWVYHLSSIIVGQNDADTPYLL